MPRLKPSDVGRLTMRQWRFPRHLQVLEEHCLRLIDDPQFNRLLVEMPVRFGKTTYAVWAFATWYLLTRPSRSVILATHGMRFSGEWSKKIQATIRDYGTRLTGVAPGRTRREVLADFAVTYGTGQGGGTLRTTSPGSPIAGRGCHLLVIDDLIRDVREAASPARRHALSTWVNSELLTRLEPDGKAVAIMSRRHPDDQSGRFQAQNAELPEHLRWHVLRMPAIGEDDTSLWEERWPLTRLLEIRRHYELEGQTYLFDSLFQQDPRGDSALVEWPDSYWLDVGYDELPPNLPARFRVLSLDPSKGSGDRTGDYSAWSDVTLDGTPAACLWVVPHLRVMPTESVEDYTVELLRLNRYDALVVECNGFQELIADNVLRKCRQCGVPCPLFKRVSPENKEVRIRLGLGPLLAQQRVRLCSRSPSYRLALNQLREFPTASHDDLPDSLNLAADLLDHLIHGRRDEGSTVYVA